MTPKEKAKELVDKFYQTTPNEAWINEPLGIAKEYKSWEQAKDCALIAVDEILEATKKYDYTLGPKPSYNDYWLKVKYQIEQL